MMTRYLPSEPEFPTKENPCQSCGSTDLDAQFRVAYGWRGWVVECLDCGEVAEYDEPEGPINPWWL